MTAWPASTRVSSYARGSGPEDLFARSRIDAMREAIAEIEEAMRTLGKGSPWDDDAKAGGDFLAPLFSAYYKKLGLPNLMAKKRFYELASCVPKEEIAPEVREKLDAIVGVAESARPGS